MTDLCPGCAFALRIRCPDRSERRYCTLIYNAKIELHREVSSCSSYQPKSNTSVRDMEKMAWIVERNRPMGFSGNRVEVKKPENPRD